MKNRMIEVRERKADDMVLVIEIDQTKVATGHLRLPRGGRHRDKRRKARVNDRGWRRDD